MFPVVQAYCIQYSAKHKYYLKEKPQYGTAGESYFLTRTWTNSKFKSLSFESMAEARAYARKYVSDIKSIVIIEKTINPYAYLLGGG
jgi:hypothetical protein